MNPTAVQLLRARKLAMEAGDTEAAELLSQRAREAQMAEDRTEYDPTAGMGTGEKLRANLGAGFADWGIGVKQLAGQASGEDAREKAARDRQLAGSVTGGRALQFTGAALPAVPFVPATVGGAVGLGAATALALPTQSDNVVAGKAAQGLAGAVTGGVVQKFGPGAVKWGANKISGKANQLADAMAKRGLGTAGRRQSIAERTFLGTVDDPRAALGTIGRYRDVPGTRPTTTQILGERRGLEIERKLRESGGQAADELGAARNASNQARYKYLQSELDKDPDKLWQAARDFAESSKGKMRVAPGGIDPRGTLIREAGRLRNSYDNPRAQAVMQEIQDRLKVALAKAPDEQLDSLHKLRMYEIDDRLDQLTGSDRKLAKALAKDLVGFKRALDKRLNEGLKGNNAWESFLTDYSSKARAAGQAEAGSELLQRIDNLTPTSTGEPALTSNRALLRKQVGAVDDFGNPKYSPLAEDAISTVDRSLDVEMRPLAPDIRPAGSATRANFNRGTNEAVQTLGPLIHGQPQPPPSVLPQAAGMGSMAGVIANPVAGLATAGATMAAGGARSGLRGMSQNAALDIAQRLFAHYRDPQVAVQALRRAVQNQQMPAALAMQVAQQLTQMSGVVGSGVMGAGAVNALQAP